MEFRKATKEDVEELGALYDAICDYLEAGTNYPGWKRDIYPTIEDAEAGVNEACLYVAIMDDTIVGTVILRNKPEEGYVKATWGKELTYDKIYVVYTLAVHPEYLHDGIGFKIMQFVETQARADQMEAIRLDVVADNKPAYQLYEKCGYTLVDTVDLGYGEYGLNWFRLYEKLL